MAIDIRSIRETLNQDYVRPSLEKVREFEVALTENSAALEYLKTTRGLTDDTISHFHLGYNKDFDAISIPTFKNGDLVNIKYRVLNPKDSKYVNEKGAEMWVFNERGFDSGQKIGKILIVEGEFDCMMAWQAGIKNVVSPAAGKDHYGVWIERLDKIGNVYIAYDNDTGGKQSARELAERIGIDKTLDVKYPDGYKDANEYLLSHSAEEFKELVRSARPYYTYEFKNMGDIINSIRSNKDDTISTPFIPKVEIEKDWLLVASGKSNVGKTSWALNVAADLSAKGIPVLVMPFERGIESVGKRYLQVKFNKGINELKESTDQEWSEMISECVDNPVYFALPKKADIVATIAKAHRLFGVKVCIIDHLDYIVRTSNQSKESEIGQTLQELKRVAEENKVAMLIITHIRKIDNAGSLLRKKPSIEDLKGSASLYQDPECVIMLQGDGKETMKVEIVKNKGEMGSQEFTFNERTGKLIDEFANF